MMIAVKATRKACAVKKACPSPRPLPVTDCGLPRIPVAASEDFNSTDRQVSGRHLASSGPIPVWKRVLDLFCIFLSLPVILPLMAVVTLWIKLASHGPVLFRQERIGRNGKRFVLYKFRSMHLNADTRRHQSYFRNLVRSNKPMVKLDLQYDSRLMRGGCILRAAGLDELPQLINVLRGEMSLVGPRPCLVEEYRFFTARQRERFEVLPGLTGIWQVHGKGTATFNEMNAMDSFYVRRCSPAMDLGIMMRTPLTLLRQLHQAWQLLRMARGKAGLRGSEDLALSGHHAQRQS